METLRIGIVGAGRNTRLRHIPGFQAIEDVEVVAVCNRSRESGQRVADEFGIPQVYDQWTDLVQSSEVDAVCIGTWPYLHSPVTLAALGADKHVLTEARMAMNADEAHAMLAAASQKPHLVTQVVPGPLTFKFDRTIQELIAVGYLGDVLSIELSSASGGKFIDPGGPFLWRQDKDLSGNNILDMGIWYECLMRWVGPVETVQAMTQINVSTRQDTDGHTRAVTVPDHVDILCRMASGAQARLRVSAVIGLARAPEVWLYGSEGTLHLDLGNGVLRGGRRGDDDLREIPVAPEMEGRWRVEQEFVNAVRGEEIVTHTSFEDGVKYMEFTDAVVRSAETGQAVTLPSA